MFRSSPSLLASDLFFSFVCFPSIGDVNLKPMFELGSSVRVFVFLNSSLDGDFGEIKIFLNETEWWVFPVFGISA